MAANPDVEFSYDIKWLKMTPENAYKYVTSNSHGQNNEHVNLMQKRFGTNDASNFTPASGTVTPIPDSKK